MLFKKLFLMCLALGLSSCGWHAVYYSNTPEADIRTTKIAVDPVPNQSGRILTQKLKDLLNPQKVSVEKAYDLSVELKETIDSDQGILGDNTATRSTMRIEAYFTLKSKGQEEPLLKEKTFATSSYNVLMTPYSTVAAEESTRKRLMEMLAQQIAMRISVYFQTIQE